MPFMMIFLLSPSLPWTGGTSAYVAIQKTGDGVRALRRIIFLDELKMPKKPDVKRANEDLSSTAWDHWQYF